MLQRRQLVQVRRRVGARQQDHRAGITPLDQRRQRAHAGEQVHVRIQHHQIGQAAASIHCNAAVPLWLAWAW